MLPVPTLLLITSVLFVMPWDTVAAISYCRHALQAQDEQ